MNTFVAYGLTALLGSTQGAAVPQTYMEVVAECGTLFGNLIPVERVQPFVADTPLAAEPVVNGHSEQCTVDFQEQDWSPSKPGSATPLLMFTVTHGGDQKRSYEAGKQMAQRFGKESFAIQPAPSGVDDAYAYTAMGRHWLVQLQGNNVITVQIKDGRDPTPLPTLAQWVREGLNASERAEWRDRQ